MKLSNLGKTQWLRILFHEYTFLNIFGITLITAGINTIKNTEEPIWGIVVYAGIFMCIVAIFFSLKINIVKTGNNHIVYQNLYALYFKTQVEKKNTAIAFIIMPKHALVTMLVSTTLYIVSSLYPVTDVYIVATTLRLISILNLMLFWLQVSTMVMQKYYGGYLTRENNNKYYIS